MRPRAWRASALSLACASLMACAAIPREKAASDVDDLVRNRGLPSAGWPTDGKAAADGEAAIQELLSGPLTPERSIQLAFLRNAEIRGAYAELGIAQADVVEASRLANPTFGYVDLRPSGSGGRSQITRSVSVDFAELLMLPARSKFARAEFDSAQQRIANALLKLANDVQNAWYEYVGAKQVAAMRDAAARAAEAAAEFARRSKDAGNLTPRELALQLAAASEARIASARAAAQAIESRTALASELGVSAREKWDTPGRLPAPLQADAAAAALVEQALSERFDVAASRRDVELLEEALGITHRWRFLGKVEVGYERESETDGERLSGPSLSIQVPLFNQGQGAVLRARSQLEFARARLAALELSTRNEVALGLDRLTAAREIAERYRTALVPQREAVVGRSLEEQNYMLIGVFELLQAKREELDAYQEYLEAVRDYWLARVELRRAAGGRLPGDGQMPELTIGVEKVLEPVPQSSQSGHQMHSGESAKPPPDEQTAEPPAKHEHPPRPDGEAS